MYLIICTENQILFVVVRVQINMGILIFQSYLHIYCFNYLCMKEEVILKCVKDQDYSCFFNGYVI